MPQHRFREPVEVLVELPDEPRLADAAYAGDREEVRLALLGRGVEERLELGKFAVAADERRLEALRLERAAQAGDDAARAPQRRHAGLALELELACFLVDDRLVRRAARRLADEHRAGLGNRLHARGRVDDVAGHHALSFGADRHGGLAREDADAGAQLLRAELLSERRDGGGEVERGADRALGVVFGGGRACPTRP